ncbi:MAG TPA: diguanylate cyclase, partial [Myxococcales bacterium]|nr:diguanylate cyclase [Myxococcales bacterium]
MHGSIGKKVLLSVGLPAFAAALLGIGALWRRADLAVGLVLGSAPAAAAVAGFAALLFASAAAATHLVIVRRLRRLAELMRRAGAGEHLVRADERGGDEIAQLGTAFNRMLAALTSLKADELEANRDLLVAREQLSLKARLEATNAQLESRLQELVTLYDVARSFTSTLELPELLERISRLVAEHLRVPRFSILLAGANGELEVKATYPPGQGTQGRSLRWSEGVWGMAAEELKVIYLPDLAAEPDLFQGREGRLPGGSLLAVPMVHKDQLLGVLDLHRPERDAFSAEEIDLLAAVADQAALAVKNARLHEQMRSLSMTDELTGAPNRRTLFQRLEGEIARAQRFGAQVSVLMIDVDHFKSLNDTAGHRAGDGVLRELYRLMSRMVRRVDTLARYGGEEFMVLLPQVSRPEAREVGEKLRRAVAEAAWPHGGPVTISVGVANLPADAATLERLADCADAA